MYIFKDTNYCSCNFCDRGKLSQSGVSLIYPYDTTFELRPDHGGMIVTICEDCLKELINLLKYNVQPTLLSITKKSIHYTSCNFCRKGTLNNEGTGLDFPYDFVFELCSPKLFRTEICEDCVQAYLYKANSSHQTNKMSKRFDL